MAATLAKIVLKRTGTASVVPPVDFLDTGEVALNYADGILYYKDNTGAIVTLPKGCALQGSANTFTGNNNFNGHVSVNSTSEFAGNAYFADALIKRVAMTPTTLTSGATVNWNTADGNVANLTLAHNATLANPTNVLSGTYVVRVTQDATGGRTLAFGSNFKTPDGGVDIIISPDANATSILTFINFGDANLYLVGQLNFA